MLVRRFIALSLGCLPFALYGMVGHCLSPLKSEGFINPNIVRSGVDPLLCYQDRFALSGMVATRYTYTNNDDLDTIGLNSRFTLNNANLIADAKIEEDWLVHLSIASIELEEMATDFHHIVRIDEAKAYYQNPQSPLFFEIGYGFTNFGTIGDPYAFVRNPTDVVATNQDIHAGVGWQLPSGVYGEFYAVGDQKIGYGVAVGMDGTAFHKPWHSKVSVISNNKHLKLVAAPRGSTWDIEAYVRPFDRFKVGGAWVQTHDAGDYAFRVWSINTDYAFETLGRPSNVHAWYANNRITHGNRLSTFAWLNGTLGARFSQMEYNTSILREVWSVGYLVHLWPSIDVSVDFLESNGGNAPGVINGLEDVAGYTLLSATFTARF